ncbi:MAG: IS4 family transposase [Verrucomicrobiales bacterium]
MFKSHLLPPADSLDLIARDSGLIQRHSRKFSAAGFLLALLQSVTKGDTSLNHLVMHLGSFVRTSMTRQAIHQRFGPASSAFLLGVLHTVLAKRFPTVIRDLRGGLFERVLIEDSVVIFMAKSNSENFPNNGNGRYATAGCKCLLLVNLLNGKPLDFQLHAAREADQSLVFESVNWCRKGDLLIRDMGFFCIASLREIGRREAFWISRLPASVSLCATDGTPPLDKLLKSTKGNRIDRAARLGREGLCCRLVAFRLPPVKAAANRRLLKREAQRRGVIPNKESLHRAGWRILVTNLDAKLLDARRIHDFYALRWRIEKRRRSGGALDEVSNANGARRASRRRGGGESNPVPRFQAVLPTEPRTQAQKLVPSPLGHGARRDDLPSVDTPSARPPGEQAGIFRCHQP